MLSRRILLALAMAGSFAMNGTALAAGQDQDRRGAVGHRRRSFLGDPEKKTLEMYVADINAKGGMPARRSSSSSMTTAAIPTRRAPSPPA